MRKSTLSGPERSCFDLLLARRGHTTGTNWTSACQVHSNMSPNCAKKTSYDTRPSSLAIDQHIAAHRHDAAEIQLFLPSGIRRQCEKRLTLPALLSRSDREGGSNHLSSL